MKIKNYLEIVDRLPQVPYSCEVIEVAYLKENHGYEYELPYNKITFHQKEYYDNREIKYKWVMRDEMDIDYNVDEIYITTNKFTSSYLNNLIHRYKFNWYSEDYYESKFFYIDFINKICHSFKNISNNTYQDYLYVEDEKIIDKIFL